MPDATTIEDITPAEANRLQGEGADLLDVREPDEWDAGHAPNAVHVPLDQVADSLDRFRDRDVLAVCRSGGRSAKAAEMLSGAGVAVRNVAGGMTAWSEAGLPVVRDDGRPGTIA